ncbi:hypothetical protein MED01_002398 [Micromonospora sp. MED01]|uniref:hypothetical protein n=1 Tax=Micromonospora alfalfae TaxID=2911212 RepID=UPI001EE7EAD4|nr:hypothetical protein [Micromonospora alfalfae]MCG5464233.1 hypothetical protein [Micromonospora alfalfae]
MTRRISVQFLAELTQFKRGMRGGADEVRNVKREAVAAQREVAGLGKAGEKAGRQLGDGITQGAERKLRGLRGRFVKAGQESGKGFGDGFEKGTRDGFGKVAGILGSGVLGAGAAAPWQGLASIPAVAGAAAVSLQGIPPLLAAIGGGLGAIPTLAAGSAASIGTVKLATAGLGDAIKETFADDRDPYLKLSRNGQKFVTSLGAQRHALMGLRDLAQNTVFDGLDREVNDLASVALPFARTQVLRFGTTWNTTFREVAALGRDPGFLAGLDAAFDTADGFFDRVNERIAPTGRSLGQLFMSSTPAVNAWGDGILGYADQFNEWIDRTARSGQLDRFFQDAAVQADALLDIGREIFTLIGRIGGMQSGSTLLRDMADALARFNAEAHNMRSVEGIIRTGNAAIAGVVDVLVVLGETLGETLADPGTAAAVALFFDVLKMGAQIVGGLAQTFGLLPDPIQAVLLAGAALVLLGGRLFSAFGKAQTAVGGLTGRLNEAGPAGQRAARGIDSSAKAAGKAVAAFAALQVASAVLSGFRRDAADVDRLAESLKKLAVNGQVSGEAQRIFGKDLDGIAMSAAGATGWYEKFNQKLEGSIPLLRDIREGVFGSSFSSHADDIKALDESLARLVETSGKTASFEVWNRVLSESGMNADELIKLFPGYAAALENAEQAAGGAAAQQQLLSGSMQDAITAMGSYTRAWEVLNGAQLSSDEAALAAKDAIDQVTEAFKTNKDVVDGNSRAALENRIAVGQAAQAAAEAAQKKYDESGSIEVANAAYDSYIAALRRTLDQTNLTDAEIDTLLATYAQMPPVKKTEVSAPGATTATRQAEDFNFAVRSVPPSKTVPFWATTKEATAAVNALKAKINDLRDKHIYISGTVRWTSKGDFKVPGGTLLKDRWGGVHEGGYMKAATGVLREAAMFGPRSPGRYMIAEPETQGEAFIPKVGNRDRAISIGRRAMEWHGMAVVPKGWLSGNPGSITTTATAPAHDSAPVIPLEIPIYIGDEVVRVVRTEISGNNRQLRRQLGAGAGRV